MKKFDLINLTFYFGGLKSNFKIMALVFVLITGTLQNAYSDTNYSEVTQLSLHLNHVSLKAALQSIEDQSEFFFVYSSKVIDVDRKVDINVKDSKIENVLDLILANSNIKYVIKDRQIMLMDGKSEAESTQQRSAVKGKVTDKNGLPLTGVTVAVKGTTQGTVTDADGNYTLEIPQGATALTFSFIGMVTQEIAIGTQTQINATMMEADIGLNEVVIVGYGQQLRAHVTGSIASVKAEELVKAPLPNITQTVVGKLPGLITKQGQGAPGLDDATLSIRGFGKPLVIIDGVEGDFNRLDPNEVESVSVLKDASASIYGSRAGNGVLLVNTKRGKLGKPVISLNASYTSQSNTRYLKPVTSAQFAELSNEFWLERGAAGTAPYTQSDIDKFRAGTDPNFPSTDWFSAIARDASPMKEYNLSVSGGSEKIKFYSYLGMLDQQSFFKSNDGNYKRYNARFNLDAKITDDLTASMDLSSSIAIRKFPVRGGDENGAYFQDLWSALPIFPAFLPDATKWAWSGGTTHPVAETNRKGDGYHDWDKTSLKGSLNLVYTAPFLKGLSLKAFGVFRRDFNFDKKYNRKYDVYKYNNSDQKYIYMQTAGSSGLSQADYRYQEMTGQFSINFDRTFGDHTINILGLYETIDYRSSTMTASRTNFLNPDFDYLFGGAPAGMANNGSDTEMGRASYIGRLNYSYKNKYLLDATIRRDASAKYSNIGRWGTFPSVTAGWRINEEWDIKDINNLKLRGGMGKSGNDGILNFQYLSGYTFGPGMAFGGATQFALQTKGLANPNLSWEEITIYNLGLDFGWKNDELYGSFDVFQRNRDGIASTRFVSLPNTFGAVAPSENLNSMTSRGWEAMLGTKREFGKLKTDISAFVSYSRSKWDRFDEPVYTDPDDIRLRQKTGNWVDRTIGYVSDGLFTSQAEINSLPYNQDGSGNTTLKPGDLKFKDLNNDKKIDWRDQAVIGNGGTPHWMYGANFSATFDGFDFSMLWQGASGYSVYNSLNGSNDMATFGNTSTATYDNRWTEANNNKYALVPRIGSNSATRLYYTDYFLKSGQYLRLKVLSIGYTLPSKWTKSAGLNTVRVYFAGTNLLTFDKLKKFGIDPETTTAESHTNDYPEADVTSQYNVQPQARNGSAWPIQKTLSLGLNITF